MCPGQKLCTNHPQRLTTHVGKISKAVNMSKMSHPELSSGILRLRGCYEACLAPTGIKSKQFDLVEVRYAKRVPKPLKSRIAERGHIKVG